MHEEFTEQTRMWDAIRPYVVPTVVVVLLGWFLFAALIGWAAPGVRPFQGVIGLLLICAVMGVVLALRVRATQRATAGGGLVADDLGLHARYGGTSRTLAWADIEQVGQLALPAPQATSLLASGKGVIAATNAVTRATAPKALGAIGPGVWQVEGATQAGRQFAALVSHEHGVSGDGRQRVPIWFTGYGGDAQRRLTELLALHRPDLVQAG